MTTEVDLSLDWVYNTIVNRLLLIVIRLTTLLDAVTILLLRCNASICVKIIRSISIVGLAPGSMLCDAQDEDIAHGHGEVGDPAQGCRGCEWVVNALKVPSDEHEHDDGPEDH